MNDLPELDKESENNSNFAPPQSPSKQKSSKTVSK